MSRPTRSHWRARTPSGSVSRSSCARATEPLSQARAGTSSSPTRRMSRASKTSSRNCAGSRTSLCSAAGSTRGSHGPDPADDYGLASYVADVEALRGHLGAEQLNLLGFSHGGCVAMAYAAAHPDGVRRLLLVDTLAVWGDEAEAEMTRMIESRSGEPWFGEAQRALEEEQAGAFSSV